MLLIKKFKSSIFFPKNLLIFKEIFFLALPLIFSQLSRVFMGLVDLAMVAGLGPEALAATASGGIIIWSVTSVALGIKTSVQTVSSRRLGQKKMKESGRAFYNGFLMAAGYSLPLFLVGYFFTSEIVTIYLDHPVSTPMSIEYTEVLFIGLIFTSMNFVFHGFLTGVEKTRIHLFVAISSNLLSIYLSAGFIYGSGGVVAYFKTLDPIFFSASKLWTWFSFPQLGVKGAAIGTVLSSLFSLVQYLVYVFLSKTRKQFHLFPAGLNLSMLKRQFQLAFPMGVQEFGLAVGWAFYLRIFSLIGIIEFATIHVIFSIMHASFMPAVGVGQACATYVGKYLGEKTPQKAEQSIKEAVRISEYIMGSMGVLFILFPQHIILMFTSDMAIVNMGEMGLRVLGVLQFLDALGITFWLSLNAAGNTIFPAMVELALLFLWLLPASYFLGVYLEIGFLGPILTLPVHFIAFTVILGFKLYNGEWKNIEV